MLQERFDTILQYWTEICRYESWLTRAIIFHKEQNRLYRLSWLQGMLDTEKIFDGLSL